VTPPELKAILQAAMEAHRASDFVRAKKLYEEFLLHEPFRPDVLYNLSLALISLNRIKEAVYYLEQVLDKIPGHSDALNNLGALLLKQDQSEQALQCFSAVLSTYPDHLEARNNLAGTLLQLGRYLHSAKHYKLYLEKSPKDISALYSLGFCLIELGKFEDAIIEFQKILAQNPEHVDAISNIGIAYLKMGNVSKAENYFQTVLEKMPDNTEIAYLYSAMTQRNMPDKPPQEYIQHLFDQYAGYYDKHMLDTLHYHTPELLLNLLKKRIPSLSDSKWDILDLGCGTGLSGFAFRHQAKTLTGVDLSKRMLYIAERKTIYDDLILDNIVEFLEKNKIQYDLLLASDVFNYIGDLDKLLKLCHSTLKNKAYLIFSVELLDDNNKNWVLESHGRYLHSKHYIQKIALEHGFSLIAIENAALREQNYISVNGCLCLFQSYSR
jgi:predicted TPR repeat methyltransferase